MSTPRLVPGPGGEPAAEEQLPAAAQVAAAHDEPNGDKVDGKQKRPGDPAGGVKKKTKKK